MTTAIRNALRNGGDHLHRSPNSDVGKTRRSRRHLEPDRPDHMYWLVSVDADDGVVTRRIWRSPDRAKLTGPDCAEMDEWQADDKDWETEDVIWPAWSPSLAKPEERHITPLHRTSEDWGRLGDRLRETAKWSSTVLGAAFALLIGTSPLGELSKASFTTRAVWWGSMGLILLFGTMWLLLRVLQPQAVSFVDVQASDKKGFKGRVDPLVRWKRAVESQQDMYLPCGINSLNGLRVAIIVEEATLAALACAVQNAARAMSRGDEAAGRHDELIQACKVRIARLQDLKDSAGAVAAIGEFYALRQRSWIACVGGVVTAAGGIACVIAGLAALAQ